MRWSLTGGRSLSLLIRNKHLPAMVIQHAPQLLAEDKQQINNIKICSINFVYLVQVLKDETIDQIYFINPDPWPKARHNKRRVINIENLNLLASKLKKNCSIVITTDSLDYYEYIVSIFKNKGLIFRKMEHEELKTTDKLYGISSYQRKAINRNEKIYKIKIFK